MSNPKIFNKTPTSTLKQITPLDVPKNKQKQFKSRFSRQNVLLYSIAVLAAFIIKFFYDLGAFKTFPEPNLKCKPLRGIQGVEDIQAISKSSSTFLLAGDRRDYFVPQKGESSIFSERIAALPNKPATIATITIDETEPQFTHCQIMNYPPNQHFHSHGIYIHNQQLFVVNHTPNGEFIDVFDITNVNGEQCQLTFLYSLTDKLFTSLNDVTAVDDNHGRTHLYVSIDTFTKDETLLRRIELYGGRPWGSIAHCVLNDGKLLNCETVATDLAFANGVIASKDGKVLYVAECTGQRIHVYQIDQKEFSLKKITSIPTPWFAPDNIDVDSESLSILVGGHPSVLQFAKHAHSHSKVDGIVKPKQPAPSQIIRIRFNDDSHQQYEIENLYEAFDGLISGSSIGVVHQNKLIIGTAMDDGVAICELDERKIRKL